MSKVFFSYSFEHQEVLERIYSFFSRYGSSYGNEMRSEIFFYNKIVHKGRWEIAVREAIRRMDTFVFFLGTKIGKTQKKELDLWRKERKDNSESILVKIMDLSDSDVEIPDDLNTEVRYLSTKGNFDPYKCFKKLYEELEQEVFDYHDGLPSNHQIFNYEKDIIKFYSNKYLIDEAIKRNPDITFEPEVEKVFKDIRKKLKQGIPPTWPEVKKNKRVERVNNKNTYALGPNPLEDIGQFREDDDRVLAAALSKFHSCNLLDKKGEKHDCKSFCMMDNDISFPEAGPREKIYLPVNIPYRRKYTVAILVSGGIAPGTNALIDSITRRHYKYARASKYADKLQVIGMKNGFKSFNNATDYHILVPDEKAKQHNPDGINTSEIISQGGSILGTSRVYDLEEDNPERIAKLEDYLNILRLSLKVNILYVIGGEGSMKAVHALSSIYEQKYPNDTQWRFNVVGIPKTMDNDILWVWQTFGFMSAVEKAREFIDYLAVETESNPRLGIVQLFGSNSGFVVSHAVLASRTGICDFALIPESDFLIEKLIIEVTNTIEKKDHGLIIASETAIPVDALTYLDMHYDIISLTGEEEDTIREYFANNRVIKGHIDDKLRDASFKIVKVALAEALRDFQKDVLTNEPRHLIRAIPPSTIDIIHASRLGILAVDNALAGYTDFMISQWLTEYCLVPMDLVVLGRKRIPKNGIFWKSVITKTGQEGKLFDKEKETEEAEDEVVGFDG